MANPLDSHWQAVKRILRYFKSTLHFGLQLLSASLHQPLPLTVFCDLDWLLIMMTAD